MFSYVMIALYDEERTYKDMKALKVSGKVLLYIVVTLLLLLLLLRLGVTVLYFDYFNNSKSEFMVPGLTSAWVPQGFHYVEDDELYLMSGYMSDGTASRVYVRYENGDTHYVELKNADGSDYTRHCGGVCQNGDFVYVAGKKGIEVFRFEDFLSNNTAVNVGKIPADYNISYCSIHNGYLFAGNFYNAESHESPEQHRITTPSGDANTSLITVYKIDELEEYGINLKPVAAISAPSKVQGICFTYDDEIVLSTSYSVASSHLYYHRLNTASSGIIQVCETEVPLFYLDSGSLTDTVTLPPMSEELVFRNGRVYVLCESACNKYIFGKFIRGYQVFSYSLEG